MKRRNTSVIVALLVAVMALSSSVALAKPAGQGGSDPGPTSGGTTAQAQAGVVSRNISASRQQAALRFWTRERMSAAPVMEMPAQADLVAADAAAPEAPEAVGAAGAFVAGAADADALAVAQAAYPEDWAALAAEAALATPADEQAGTSQVYTSYVANLLSSMQNIYPHVWMGRLVFNTPSGTSSCSATVLRNNTIVTAAHCLYDTTNNRWYSNWVFAPAFRNGSAPFGTFPASVCTILTSYVNLSGSYSINGWARHDVGVCTLRPNSARRTINQAVGWAGYQWNQPTIRHFHNTGYPARDFRLNTLPSASQYLRACVAESFVQTTETRGMGCNWGPGISGGSWLIGYAPGAVSGFVDGVNSGLFIGVQNLYGPRFNSSNIVPLCAARGC